MTLHLSITDPRVKYKGKPFNTAIGGQHQHTYLQYRLFLLADVIIDSLKWITDSWSLIMMMNFIRNYSSKNRHIHGE